MPTARAERIALSLSLAAIALLAGLMFVAAKRYREEAEAASATAPRLVIRHQQLAHGNRIRRDGGQLVRRHESPPPPAPAPPAVPAESPAARRTPARPAAPVAPVSPPAVRLTAARGDCWAEVRVVSESGSVLYSGILARGQARTFRGKRLWIRLGAPENVDATIDRKPASIPGGTLNVIVTRRGFRAAA
ncbi:MAG: DUF4115 domain-containing protein [Gaiellaceae bacterium]